MLPSRRAGIFPGGSGGTGPGGISTINSRILRRSMPSQRAKAVGVMASGVAVSGCSAGILAATLGKLLPAGFALAAALGMLSLAAVMLAIAASPVQVAPTLAEATRAGWPK